MHNLMSSRWWLVLGIGGVFLLVVGVLLGTGVSIMGNDYVGAPVVSAQGGAGGVGMEFLACRPSDVGPGAPICDLITGFAQNDLVSAPPAGTLAVLEPNTNVHQAEWESAPLAAPVTLLPGPVTLDLVLTNLSENAGTDDICWSKHAVLPDGSETVIVPFHCFENPLPVVGFICPFGGLAPDIPANCLAAAGLVTETVTSSITAPTVLPAGTVIELSVACPGASFIAVFFNDGIDVDGDGVDEFSKITEPARGKPSTAESPRVVVLDPGHGGSSTVGGSSPNGAVACDGTLEKDLVLQMARRVRDLLPKSRYEVLLTRDADVNIGLAARAQVANGAGADLFMSLHMNSSLGDCNGTAEHSEAFYAVDQVRSSSTRLAQQTCAVVRRHLNTIAPGRRCFAKKDTETQQGASTVLRTLDVEIPGILFEAAFIDTEDDWTLLQNNFDEFALALVDAIECYEFGERCRP